MELNVKVLNCDTITQVKDKILDAFFKGSPFTKRPSAHDLDLVYIPTEFKANASNRLVLYDEDKTCKMDHDEYKRLNTLSHYKIANGALLLLVSRQTYQLIHSSDTGHGVTCSSYTMLDAGLNHKNAENMTLLSKSSKGSSSPPTYSKLSTNGLNEYMGSGGYSAMNGSVVGLTESILLTTTTTASAATQLNTNSSRLNSNYMMSKNGTGGGGGAPNASLLMNNSQVQHTHTSHSANKVKKYHLIKPNDSNSSTTPNLKDDKSDGKQEIAAKLVSEVYLTRLLATKVIEFLKILLSQ